MALSARNPQGCEFFQQTLHRADPLSHVSDVPIDDQTHLPTVIVRRGSERKQGFDLLLSHIEHLTVQHEGEIIGIRLRVQPIISRATRWFRLPLPEGSIYQSPVVIRALYVALRTLENAQRVENRKRGSRLPENAGKAWSTEEDERLIAEFDAGKAPVELAQSFGRTVAGIHARLARLGRLINTDGFAVRGGGGMARTGLSRDAGHEPFPSENQLTEPSAR